ncbi:hypothetical protein SP19_69 [Salmonella phage 19]|nr:hypothetical protein SP19_69 [Salmonella phage 19]
MEVLIRGKTLNRQYRSKSGKKQTTVRKNIVVLARVPEPIF